MKKKDRKALFDIQTDRVGVDLIEISANGIQPLYLCRNTEAIISRGNTYLPTGMEVSKPEKGGENVNASLRISGVNRDHMALVQNLSPDAVVTVMNAFVFADEPDDYVDGPYSFVVEGVSVESSTGTIEMELAVDNPLDYTASQMRYDSEGFPAIWV